MISVCVYRMHAFVGVIIALFLDFIRVQLKLIQAQFKLIQARFKLIQTQLKLRNAGHRFQKHLIAGFDISCMQLHKVIP